MAALLDPDAPAVQVWEGPPEAADRVLAEVTADRPGTAVVKISGDGAGDEVGFLGAVRRALRMPYESIGWDAFAEALFDMTWMPADAYVLVVERGDLLLRDSHSGLEILADILGRAADYPAQPRRLVLISDPDSAGDLRDRLDEAGARYATVLLSGKSD